MYINKNELDVLMDTAILLESIAQYDAIKKDNKIMTHISTNLEKLITICNTQHGKQIDANKKTWERIKAKRKIDPTYARSYEQKETMRKKEVK